jgi:hypothetical protein
VRNAEVRGKALHRLRFARGPRDQARLFCANKRQLSSLHRLSAQARERAQRECDARKTRTRGSVLGSSREPPVLWLARRKGARRRPWPLTTQVRVI